jgi:TonB family protein
VQAGLQFFVKRGPAIVPWLASCLIHAAVIFSVFNITAPTPPPVQRQLVRLELVDLPRIEPEPSKRVQESSQVRKRPPPLDAPKGKEATAFARTELSEPQRVAPAPPPKEEAQHSVEASSPVDAKAESTAVFSSIGGTDASGLERRGENLFRSGDVGGLLGAETSTAGGADSTVNRGSGAARSTAPALNRLREAKPIQTARVAYPPMALRMGLEGDVTLKIQIDADGRVTSAEIIKSAGMGFDEEALRSVKQSRFEPAQKDGQNVPAEFTYIYRFRLQR